MIRIIIVLVIAGLGLSSAFMVQSLRGSLNLANDKVVSQAQTIKDRDASLQAEREWATQTKLVLAALVDIGKEMETLRGVMREQDTIQANALKELIKNDKAVRDYMQLAVPSNLGVQYIRNPTTDPTKWRPNASVQPSSVPATGKGAVKK